MPKRKKDFNNKNNNNNPKASKIEIKSTKRKRSSTPDSEPQSSNEDPSFRKFQKVKHVSKKFITNNLPPRDEIRFLNTFRRNNEVKNLDTRSNFFLYNEKGTVSPILLNGCQQGKSNYQRVGCQITNLKIKVSMRIQYPFNTFEINQEDNRVLPIPETLMRWAIVYSNGKLSDQFKFTNLFQDVDNNGDIITINDYMPVEDPQLYTNAYSYIRAGNTFQGYQKGFNVIKEGFINMAGYCTSLYPDIESVNGTFFGEPYSNSNSKFSFNGDQFKEFDISLLDENMLTEINGGNLLTTQFKIQDPQQEVTLESIDNGAIMFIYGVSYPEVLSIMPIMTLLTRVEYVDNG